MIYIGETFCTRDEKICVCVCVCVMNILRRKKSAALKNIYLISPIKTNLETTTEPMYHTPHYTSFILHSRHTLIHTVYYLEQKVIILYTNYIRVYT